MTKFPIIWITGNMNAGKTTLAKGIEHEYNESINPIFPLARRVVVLDGDEMRSSISLQETLSADDRRKHNLRVARLARVLQSHGFFVVVAVIAPFRSVRAEIDALCEPVWVYVKRSLPEHVDRPYEIPESPACIIDNDQYDIAGSLRQFLLFMQSTYPQYFALTSDVLAGPNG
jgi:adenylylsulfate kinase